MTLNRRAALIALCAVPGISKAAPKCCVGSNCEALAQIDAALGENHATCGPRWFNHVEVHEVLWSRRVRGVVLRGPGHGVVAAANHFGESMQTAVGAILLCGSTHDEATSHFRSLRGRMSPNAYVLYATVPATCRPAVGAVPVLAWPYPPLTCSQTA